MLQTRKPYDADPDARNQQHGSWVLTLMKLAVNSG